MATKNTCFCTKQIETWGLIELVWNGKPFCYSISNAAKFRPSTGETFLSSVPEGAKGPDCHMVPGLGDALQVVGLKKVPA